MPPSSFLMVSLNHVNELGLYRLKCTIPLMCFHSFACKGRRIPTSLPLTQHVKACEVLRVWPLLLHMQPIHIWNVRNKTAQITCSQSHDTDKRRTCCRGSLLPGSRSNTAHTRAHRSQGKKIMRLFSNQQIAFMLWVSGEACEALIRSFALRCFPVAPRMPLSANWIGWPFSPHNQIDCISPKRLFHFNYHKFVILHPPCHVHKHIHAGTWNSTMTEKHTFCLKRCRSLYSMLSTVPWLSLLWHHSEEDITVTNETPQNPQWAWQGLKGQYVCVCACVRGCKGSVSRG